MLSAPLLPQHPEALSANCTQMISGTQTITLGRSMPIRASIATSGSKFLREGVCVVRRSADGERDYYCSGDQGGPVTSNDAYRDLSISGWENQLSSFKCEAM